MVCKLLRLHEQRIVLSAVVIKQVDEVGHLL